MGKRLVAFGNGDIVEREVRISVSISCEAEGDGFIGDGGGEFFRGI